MKYIKLNEVYGLNRRIVNNSMPGKNVNTLLLSCYW
nr:MAG TPA: hypothetical protein [Bacteriophage sp.]